MARIIYFFAQDSIFSQIVDLPKVDAPDTIDPVPAVSV